MCCEKMPSVQVCGMPCLALWLAVRLVVVQHAYLLSPWHKIHRRRSILMKAHGVSSKDCT